MTNNKNTQNMSFEKQNFAKGEENDKNNWFLFDVNKRWFEKRVLCYVISL